MFDPLHPTPPGWPPQVEPPGLPGWEQSASKWLFEQVPGEWRTHDVYQRNPLLHARDVARLDAAVPHRAGTPLWRRGEG